MNAKSVLGTLCLLAISVGVLGGSCPFTGFLGLPPTLGFNNKAVPWTPPSFSAPSSCTAQQYEQIAQDLAALGKKMEALPTMLRLAFHTCGTWSASGRNGGCNGGWLQFPNDSEHFANVGLPNIVAALKELKSKWECITFADLSAFLGSVVIEAAGGPPIAWYPGRRDALGPGPSSPGYPYRLPFPFFEAGGSFSYLDNLGFTMREGVALIGGGHSLGGAHKNATGFQGSFTPFGSSWPVPKNRYFTDLLGLGWQCELVEGNPARVHYVPSPGQDATYTAVGGKKVFRFPSDVALRTEPLFSYWLLAYAKDESLFIRDFQRAMQRLLQLGAGDGWEVDTSYLWKGFKGDWEGFGPDIPRQLDTEDLPVSAAGDPADFMKATSAQLADWSKPFPLSPQQAQATSKRERLLPKLLKFTAGA